MKNSEAFDITVSLLTLSETSPRVDNTPWADFREDFLREAGVALAASRKAALTQKGGKITEKFSTRTVCETIGMTPGNAARFAGAWAFAHGIALGQKLDSGKEA